MPDDIKWPVNPNGEKLTFILNLPTNFLDSIVYHGDMEELENIKNGFAKVILHSVGSPRNDSDCFLQCT